MTRMAPFESPVCDALALDIETWEAKALHMLDILQVKLNDLNIYRNTNALQPFLTLSNFLLSN